MPQRMHRTQIFLSEDEYRRLRRVAQERRRSLGSIVREAIENYYPEGSREDRIAAAERITTANLDLPPFDWEEWEKEYMRIKGRPCGEQE